MSSTIFFAAKALIYSSKKLLRNKVLLGKRTITGGYEPLGGRLDQHETPEEALHREILEEAGLSIHILSYIGSYRFQWYTDPSHCTVCMLFRCAALQCFPDRLESMMQEVNELEIIPEWVPMSFLPNLSIHPLQNEFKELLLKSL